MRINFLVIVVAFILFILIVNATEQNIAVEDIKNNENNNNNYDIGENNNNNEAKSKPITASFGVYLQIVG